MSTKDTLTALAEKHAHALYAAGGSMTGPQITAELLRFLTAALDEIGVERALDDVQSMGRGKNDGEEYYCPCCGEHSPDDQKIPHRSSCIVGTTLTTIRAVIDANKEK